MLFSIFLPFIHLGLIIVDEEHDPSFKQQDPSPRYNARDLSLVLAKIFNAHVVLGSATPSLESYFNSLRGKYKLVEIKYSYFLLFLQIIIFPIKIIISFMLNFRRFKSFKDLINRRILVK